MKLYSKDDSLLQFTGLMKEPSDMVWSWLDKKKNILFLVFLIYFSIDFVQFLYPLFLPIRDSYGQVQNSSGIAIALTRLTYQVKPPFGFFLFYGLHWGLVAFAVYNIIKNPNWLIKIVGCLATAYYLLIMLMLYSASRS